MVLAGLYYLMSILLLTSGFGYFLTALSLPFIIFWIVDVIKNKRRGLPNGKNLVLVLIALTVFIIGTVLAPEPATLEEKARENTISTIPSPSERSAVREQTKVIRVIDGDTFEIENGKTVRLIGVDSPESVHPDQSKNTELGKIASTFSKEKLEGITVYLEKDISETDKYGRLLRYVYLEDGSFYNEYLVKEGMANPATYPPDVKYADVFVKAQQVAKENNKGLWAINEQVAPTPTPLPTPAPAPATNPPAKPETGSQSGGADTYVDAEGNGLIKGNINSKGEKIYHLPGGQFYDKTIPEAWFKTEKEAIAAGFRKSMR